jgi:threonine dehydrogenase-like Zn-dependent dehydrogenase
MQFTTGKIKPKGIITKVLRIDEVNEGVNALAKDKDNQCKILIHRQVALVKRNL